MSAEQPRNPHQDPERPLSPEEPAGFTQQIQHSSVSARVPEKVGRGVLSTGVMVFQGTHEFVVDFVQNLAPPHQIVARVILPFSIMPSVIEALRENLNNYQAKFGPPPVVQAPTPPSTPPPIEEIYNQLKLPDELLSGVYANVAMISHSPSEFYFDFITSFFPRSAVSCRIFFSAPQIPGILNTLIRSYQQFQQKLAGG